MFSIFSFSKISSIQTDPNKDHFYTFFLSKKEEKNAIAKTEKVTLTQEKINIPIGIIIINVRLDLLYKKRNYFPPIAYQLPLKPLKTRVIFFFFFSTKFTRCKEVICEL